MNVVLENFFHVVNFLLIYFFASGQEPLRKVAGRLAKPLIGDDGRVYTCSEKNFYAFNRNGSIAWTITLNYSCNSHIAPVHGGSRKARFLLLTRHNYLFFFSFVSHLVLSNKTSVSKSYKFSNFLSTSFLKSMCFIDAFYSGMRLY